MNETDLAKFYFGKTVLVREHKGHTARHVASTRFGVLSPEGGGVSHLVLARVGGYPILSWPSYAILAMEVPLPVLTGGYPIQPGQVVPHPVLAKGYLGLRYPPEKDLEPETWERKQSLGYPPREGHGTSLTPPSGGQSENITFRHPWDARGAAVITACNEIPILLKKSIIN